jgi:hypothetical protein
VQTNENKGKYIHEKGCLEAFYKGFVLYEARPSDILTIQSDFGNVSSVKE